MTALPQVEPMLYMRSTRCDAYFRSSMWCCSPSSPPIFWLARVPDNFRDLEPCKLAILLLNSLCDFVPVYEVWHDFPLSFPPCDVCRSTFCVRTVPLLPCKPCLSHELRALATFAAMPSPPLIVNGPNTPTWRNAHPPRRLITRDPPPQFPLRFCASL